MRSRKRFSAQPILEPMEPRVVPSAMVMQAHQGHVVAAHVHQIDNSQKPARAVQIENNQALRSLRQQQHLVHVHALEHTPSAIPTKAEQAASAVSNFFKSAAQSL